MDRLRYWLEVRPDDPAYSYISDGVELSDTWTYVDVDRRARAIAAQLQERKLEGERALLLYPPGLDFVAGFFGCLLAGVIAVPAFPPRRNRNMGRIQAIADDCCAAAALTVRDVEDRTMTLLDETSSLRQLHWLSTDAISLAAADDWQRPNVSSGDLAFLQYTSGSTGSPKGVMLSHGNIIDNCSMITRAFESAGEGTSGLSWLPTYHDMGLIGGVLNPLYCGRPSTLMSPMMFLQKPIRWLLCTVSWVILPLFIVAILISLVACIGVTTSAETNADFCSGGVEETPEATIVAIMDQLGVRKDLLGYQIAIFYIFQCNRDDNPFEFLSKYNFDLVRETTYAPARVGFLVVCG